MPYEPGIYGGEVIVIDEHTLARNYLAKLDVLTSSTKIYCKREEILGRELVFGWIFIRKRLVAEIQEFDGSFSVTEKAFHIMRF